MVNMTAIEFIDQKGCGSDFTPQLVAALIEEYAAHKSAEDNKELVDNITSLNKNMDAYWNGSRSDARIIAISKDQQRSLELIQKHSL